MSSPAAERYVPPLRWYSHLWRLVLCAIVSAATWSGSWGGQWQAHRAQFWIDLGVGLAAFALCLQRRRWPFLVAVTLAAATAVSAVAVGPAILAAVSFATHRKVGRIVVLGVLLVLASRTYAHTQPISSDSGFRINVTGGASQSRSSPPLYLDVLGAVLATSGVLGWGMYLGSRRELLWTLRDRAESAEAERDLRLANARTTERARIAREMHDVVAHRISQVSMQSGAMAFRNDLDVDQLRAGAEQIQGQANLALTELRGVLGVLRAGGSHELLVQPQPTYNDLRTMINESAASGMSIDFNDLIGLDVDVPENVGRTVFRIVQEGLTNARKHAPGALVRIELSGSREAGIEVLVRNGLGFVGAPAAPGSGLGLIGLVERAELQGGRLAGRREGTTFVLHGWIPWAP